MEELEEAIKAFLTFQGKELIHTESYTLTLVEGRLDISARSKSDINQLTLDFVDRYQR